MLQIVNYNEAYKPFIKTLNYEWLQKYFEVEPNDTIQLSDPQTHILDKGGHIFFALNNDEVVGTSSLMKISEDEYELAKMAVTEKYKGFGIGTQLLEHCISEGKKLNAKRLCLYSNTSLGAAIHLYEKYGFYEIPLPSEIHYSRADIKMQLDL